MKKLLLVAALALTCAGIAAPRANAQSAQFVFTPLNFNPNMVAPGQSIQFSINIVVTVGGNVQDIQGLTIFLQQIGGSTFPFSITGRQNDTTAPTPGGTGGAPQDSPFLDEISTNSQLLSTTGGNNIIDANGNERDIGALADAPLGSGNYFVANITLSVAANAAPGAYTIQSVTSGGRTGVFNDSEGDTFPVQPGSLTIMIPEPSTYALLALGAVGMGVVVYRRRRATASA